MQGSVASVAGSFFIGFAVDQQSPSVEMGAALQVDWSSVQRCSDAGGLNFVGALDDQSRASARSALLLKSMKPRCIRNMLQVISHKKLLHLVD